MNSQSMLKHLLNDKIKNKFFIFHTSYNLFLPPSPSTSLNTKLSLFGLNVYRNH